MIRLELKKYGKLHSFYLPETWDEIEQEDMLEMAPFLLKDTPEHRLNIVFAYLPKKVVALFFQLPEAEVYRITSRLDWLYDTCLDKPLIPFFKNDKGKIYHLPAQGLSNCVIVEYVFADKYFEDIRKGDSSKIDALILALCRPQRKDYEPDSPDYDGDIREKFNENLIDSRVKDMKNVDMRLKMYFLLFFMGCKRSLAQKYSPLFAEAEEDSDSITRPDFGFVGIIWELAGGVVNQDKVQFTHLHDIFGFLCKQHFDNLALQEKYDTAQRI